MATLLNELLDAGLIEKLDGDDERFAKMEKAAKAVAQELLSDPPRLIRALLAGLDPDVAADDPAITQAEAALVIEWKSMRSVHPSSPVALLRAILLDACNQAAAGKNAAVLWLTAADTLPLMHLGREESVVRRMLEHLAESTERESHVVSSTSPDPSAGPPMPKLNPASAAVAPPSRAVDRAELLLRVAATAGPIYRTNKKLPGPPNPHWSNEASHWSWEFADRMHVLLADELDSLARDVDSQQAEHSQRLRESQIELITSLSDGMTAQQRWVQDALKASQARRQSEDLRLSVLWWSEAVYSQSLSCSYRELPAPLAAVVMPIDLLHQVGKPTPASVGYLLTEAVNKLPEADFSIERTLPNLVDALRSSRSRLSERWLNQLSLPPTRGRLSLRDLVVLTLRGPDWDLGEVMGRAGLTAETSLSLPSLARALFRQEQAVLLAGGAQ